MLSMQLSNIPFYELEGKMLLDFQDSGRRFDKGRGNSGGGGVELRPPSDLCLHILCKLYLYTWRPNS